ncbi:MAG: hypothetical protein M3264_07630 [Thermoproteota archaeon]|nr:hypothetical protein [Thermoproteota archaeon]
MLLVFNKNKKNSSLTTGITIIIIIIMMSLSYLPLDNGHTSALLLFSTEPVFAQLSGQVILPYGEEQVSTVPFTSSSSSSSPTMDFSMFMDSFANSIFNGTSTFAGVGTSIVDGVEVNGVSLDKIQNQLSVTLSRTAATQVQGSNDNITSADTTITSLSIPNSNSVSVIAMRIPISMSDILSIAAASSSSSSSLNSLDSGIGDSTAENELNSFSSDTFNPFSLLSNLQIGSSTLIDVDWSEPQTVTMDLVGSSRSNQEEELNSSSATRADFVLVSVIPHTGVSNNTLSSALP